MNNEEYAQTTTLIETITTTAKLLNYKIEKNRFKKVNLNYYEIKNNSNFIEIYHSPNTLIVKLNAKSIHKPSNLTLEEILQNL